MLKTSAAVQDVEVHAIDRTIFPCMCTSKIPDWFSAGCLRHSGFKHGAVPSVGKHDSSFIWDYAARVRETIELTRLSAINSQKQLRPLSIDLDSLIVDPLVEGRSALQRPANTSMEVAVERQSTQTDLCFLDVLCLGHIRWNGSLTPAGLYYCNILDTQHGLWTVGKPVSIFLF